MAWSGRTQRSAPSPQRIDFGHGKPRTTASTVSATTVAAGRPGCSITATRMLPFLSARVCNWSRVRPVERRKPSIAFSGASARGPLRSSRSRGEFSARSVSANVSRRGVAKAAAWP